MVLQWMVQSFTLALFTDSFGVFFGETQFFIKAMTSKINLNDTHPEKVQNWSEFWEFVTCELHNVIEIPQAQSQSFLCIPRKTSAALDVQPVNNLSQPWHKLPTTNLKKLQKRGTTDFGWQFHAQIRCLILKGTYGEKEIAGKGMAVSSRRKKHWERNGEGLLLSWH